MCTFLQDDSLLSELATDQTQDNQEKAKILCGEYMESQVEEKGSVECWLTLPTAPFCTLISRKLPL
jgi:hypothetical protein